MCTVLVPKRLFTLALDFAYLANAATMAKKEQDGLFKEQINLRLHHSTGYKLLISIIKSNWYSFDLCLNSFLNLIVIGKKRFKSLNETHHILGGNVHKNIGNGNACISNEALQSIVAFIQLKGKHDGEAYETRAICSLTRNELRDEEKGTID
jgi:hypothetical protein